MFGYLASPELGKGAAAELVAADLWAATDDGYEVRNYLEYQPSKAERDNANKAAAERMRSMRARRYQPPKGQEQGEPLRCNIGVTSSELPAKFALPDPVPIPSRPDPVPIPSRPDPVLNKASCAKPDQSQPELALVPQQAAESGKGKASANKLIAVTLFGELQAARKRVNPNVRLTDKHADGQTKEIERCLRKGYTAEQLRNVILCWEALVNAGKREREHFNSVTPFRAANVAQYVEMSLDDARKPRNAAPAPWQAPKPESGLDRLGRLAREELERRERAESAIEVTDAPYMLGEGDER